MQVAVGPRFPIGYNGLTCNYVATGVAVGPRFPIGYNETINFLLDQDVAVGPRFPIGYNPSSLKPLLTQWIP